MYSREVDKRSKIVRNRPYVDEGTRAVFAARRRALPALLETRLVVRNGRMCMAPREKVPSRSLYAKRIEKVTHRPGEERVSGWESALNAEHEIPNTKAHGLARGAVRIRFASSPGRATNPDDSLVARGDDERAIVETRNRDI